MRSKKSIHECRLHHRSTGCCSNNATKGRAPEDFLLCLHVDLFA
jgi:hypothetical protein